MKYIFIIFFSFCGLFFNNGLKAAEKINIKFEEMEIPLTIEQLSKLEKYKDDSTEMVNPRPISVADNPRLLKISDVK